MDNVLDPSAIVNHLHLTNGDYVADFGSGHGYFVMPLAKAVAPNGKVFAIDIQREMLDTTRSALQSDNIHNVEYIWTDLEQSQGSKLKDEFVDLVLVTNILHQSSQKDAIIKEAHRIVRPTGRLVLIEWIKDEKNNTVFGPPNELRISEQDAVSICTNQSFIKSESLITDNHHYGIVFNKNPKS